MIGDFFAIFSIAYKGCPKYAICTDLMMSPVSRWISIKAEDSFCNGGCLWFRDVFWRVSRFGIGKFFVSGRTVCFYCSVVKSGKFCSRSRFRTDWFSGLLGGSRVFGRGGGGGKKKKNRNFCTGIFSRYIFLYLPFLRLWLLFFRNKISQIFGK